MTVWSPVAMMYVTKRVLIQLAAVFRLHRLLLATGVLGHCLGPLADCVFAQLAG